MDMDTKNRIREADNVLEHSEYMLDQFGEGNKVGMGRARSDIWKAREILNGILKEYRQEQAQRRQAKRGAGDWTMDQ